MSSSDSRTEHVKSNRLLLVRHAQASFGSADYDALSERGRQQATHLGAWLASDPDLQLAAVCCGTLHRQEQTLAAIALAFAATGRVFPDIVKDADWNEFDHEAVIRAYAQAHPQDPQLAAALAGHDRRSIHALLVAGLRAWASGTLDDAVPETWATFGERTACARARIERTAAGGKILIISSGGVIARCAQAALGCDDARTVDLNLSLRNTAISEFRSAGESLRLLTWNALPHYAAPSAREWVTYY